MTRKLVPPALRARLATHTLGIGHPHGDFVPEATNVSQELLAHDLKVLTYSLDERGQASKLLERRELLGVVRVERDELELKLVERVIRALDLLREPLKLGRRRPDRNGCRRHDDVLSPLRPPSTRMYPSAGRPSGT